MNRAAVCLAAVAMCGCARPGGVGGAQPLATAAAILAPIPPRPHRPPRPATSDLAMVAQVGHSKHVWAIAVSRDGQLLASAGLDKAVRLWRVDTGMLVRTFAASPQAVRALAFSPDGRLLAACGGPVRVWETATGNTVRTIDANTSALEFLGRGTELALATADGQIVVVDAADGREVSRVAVAGDATFSGDGRTATVTGPDGLWLWDIVAGKAVRHLDATVGFGQARVAYLAPDGRTAVVDRNGPEMTMLDVEAARFVGPLEGASGEPMAWSPDGERVVTAGYGLRVWDAASRRVVRTIETGLTGLVVRYLPDGRSVVIGGEARHIEVWDVERGVRVRALPGAAEVVEEVAVTDAFDAIYAAQGDAIKVWDPSTLGLSRVISGRGRRVISLAVSADGKTLVHVAEVQNVYRGKVIVVSDARTGAVIREIDAGSGRVALSRDASIAIVAEFNDALLIEVATGKQLARLSGATNDVKAVAIAAEARRAATASTDRSARVWDLDTGAEIAVFQNDELMTGVALSPDGKRLATAGWACQGFEDCGRHRAHLWDVETRALLRTMEGHTDEPNAVAFAPDATRVATASDDGTVKLWRAADGTLERTFTGHADGVTSVAFSHDGRFIVSSSADGSVRIWRVDGEASVSLMSRGDEWIAFDDEGYFDASRHGGELVGAIRGTDAFRVQQLAVRNNRPDFLLEAMELGSPDLLQHYWARTVRRLRQLRLDPEDVDRRFAGAPSVAIVSFDVRGKFVDLEAELIAGSAALRRYNVWANDVPLLGASGQPVSGARTRIKQRVELAGGTNKIEIAATDARGTESLRAFREATYGGRVRGDLYYIGFGVSRYRDRRLDLRYAHKDVLDLARYFRAARGPFARVHVLTRVDAQATAANIMAARSFLADAKVDDTVVLFVAGHGTHTPDAAADYVFVTHETDLARLRDTSASFETIEGLLQGIRPRRKLFLMDTCESGEMDEVAAAGAGPGQRGLHGRSIRSLVFKKAGAPSRARPFLAERDRFIETDLVRRTGAIVFSSSRGSEPSYEIEKLQNGAFTSAIKDALTTTAADVDRDHTVSTDELRRYVARAVAALTGDLQHPTVDRDNPAIRFGFPVRTGLRDGD
ncbi:MAG TPA: caspase family protein [Kofleriaceae bacterium]|nr:caspase family protein [Kofleriaceae bacterium]